MNPWDLFCELCKVVVEEQNVCLNIVVFDNQIQMSLIPCEGNFYDETDD